VIIFDKRRVEYIDDAKGTVNEYYSLHKIIHLNDDRGIESFNKIYLGIIEGAEIIDVRARSILPNGKILELDRNNIKDLKEEDGNIYKIFAMEGLEKGCEIEYFYTFHRSTSYFGRELVQASIPVLETVFQIIGPERLRFEIKPYNFSAVGKDTLLNNKRWAEYRMSEAPALDEEKYAFHDAHLRRIEFKLSYNDARNKGERLFTWNEYAQRIYGIYAAYTDKEYKSLSALVRKNGWDMLSDEPQKIMAVENYVKKNFSYNEEANGESANQIENIIQNKSAGMVGILRFYSTIFQILDIHFQFVFTGDREKYMIDKDFENWNNCENPLFYFPAEKKYFAPTRIDLRYPWFSPLWGGMNALFCKHTSLGNFSTALAEIRAVDLEGYNESRNDIESRLEFEGGLDSLLVDSRQIYQGYSSIGLRDEFNFANEEQKRALLKELVKMVSNSEHIVFSEILNPEFENLNTNKPLIIHAKTKSDELLEKAGNKLLIKIGMAIGPQVEMYQEKPRQMPVNVDFPHVEERKIDLVIPEGYKLKNPEDLKMEQTFSENGEITMGFVSSYETKGNVLSIHILEQYRKLYYPLSQFDAYRKIINASSDFNKVVLVLEKK